MVRAALALLLAAAAAGAPQPAPAFPGAGAERWIGEAQSWQRLRGKVVLLDVWTFG
jgi:hypothetical protein